MKKINQLRTGSEDEAGLDKLRLDFLLFVVYLFGFLDLFLTWLVGYKVNQAVELNPVYYIGGRGLLVFLKLVVPLFVYYLCKMCKVYVFMYVLVFMMVCVVYWNVFILLAYI